VKQRSWRRTNWNQLTFVTRWFLVFAPSLLPPPTGLKSDEVREIIRSLRAFMRKTGALLGTTFVLSLHAVFHNVICNWCNRAVQFLSIIVLGCPLQPCPAHVYNTCPWTGRPISRVLSRILWIFEQAERFYWRCRAYRAIVRGSSPVYSRDTRKLEGTSGLNLDYRRSVPSPGNSKGFAKDFAV